MNTKEKKELFMDILKDIVKEEVKFMGKVLIGCAVFYLTCVALSKKVPD